MTATMEGTATAVPSDEWRYVFGVIVEVPGDLEYGNRAVPPFSIMVDAQAFGGRVDDPPRPLIDLIGGPMAGLMLRTPVFLLGEILVLDSEGGREVVGLQRKPSKWSVRVEHFDTIADAVARSQEVNP